MAKGFTKDGREILDDTPVELPVGFKHPPSLAEEIRRLVAINLSQAAAEAGHESLDEASDFDIPDEEELVVSGLQLKTMEEDVIMAQDAEEAAKFVEQHERKRHENRVEPERRDGNSGLSGGSNRGNQQESGESDDSRGGGGVQEARGGDKAPEGSRGRAR